MFQPNVYALNNFENLTRTQIKLSNTWGWFPAARTVIATAPGASTEIGTVFPFSAISGAVKLIPALDASAPPVIPDIKSGVDAIRFIGRIEAAKHFLASNNINKITVRSDNDSIGIITAGKTYYDIVEALDSLGWDEAFLNEKGIRILKLGATFPVDSNIIKKFTEGLNEVLLLRKKIIYRDVNQRRGIQLY